MDIEQKDKFIELRAGGMSFDNISKQLNISKPTLLKLNRELAAANAKDATHKAWQRQSAKKLAPNTR